MGTSHRAAYCSPSYWGTTDERKPIAPAGKGEVLCATTSLDFWKTNERKAYALPDISAMPTLPILPPLPRV